MVSTLLTREHFKEAVFKRDNATCVLCTSPAVDAHHIIDRNLWKDGGYYIDNGVCLCASHHVDAEKTLISCAELRKKAGIDKIVLPEHFMEDDEYDHWGNIILPGNRRIKGELFYNENVQKILRSAEILNEFLSYVKYPRTYHLPDSPNLQNDDRQHQGVSFFNDKEVIGTLKMDGEGTSMYSDYIHARSINSGPHESRTWVKALHGKIAHDIPKDFHICGENLYATHSIHYRYLKSYFYVFSVWDERNTSLSWDQTVMWAQLLDLQTVPVFYRGVWDREKIQASFECYCRNSKDEVEGFVVRLQESFPYQLYRLSTAKYVRVGHVTTDEFWMNKSVIPNELEKC